MNCSLLAATEPLSLWYSCGAAGIILLWIKLTFKANLNGIMAAPTASSHGGRKTDRGYLKVESSNTIRGSHEFLEKAAWSVVTEMLLVIAYIWKKLLPQDACHPWSRIQLYRKTGNWLLMGHALAPDLTLLQIRGSASKSSFVWLPFSSSLPEKKSKVISRSVPIENALS